ncbi:hypothetical protein [Absiella sp. AM29-15]|uniref:hypothetical protein n=1 Tax=Absiella sp. AM29-15 TaxID=2292278 RepID=UPI000E428E59|nr:hypothetical protein [Absiella sp. AM29-15]RGC53008.1 hypothetical protein DW761_05035 [Absiella sp. AM29-15]
MNREKKLNILTVSLILCICFVITITFHFVDKRLGFYLGFVRAIFYLCAGAVFCFITYHMLKKRDQYNHASFQDMGMLVLKFVLLCVAFIWIVIGMYAIARPFETDRGKAEDWIIFVFGIFSFIAMIILFPKIKRWWKLKTVSNGMISLVFMLLLTGMGIFSIIGGGVEIITHLQDLTYLDEPDQVMLFHCSSMRKHTSRSIFYTQIKGYDEFGDLWIFDSSSYKMRDDAQDGYCIVDYLPHTKTVMSISFINDGIDWDDS